MAPKLRPHVIQPSKKPTFEVQASFTLRQHIAVIAKQLPPKHCDYAHFAAGLFSLSLYKSDVCSRSYPSYIYNSVTHEYRPCFGCFGRVVEFVRIVNLWGELTKAFKSEIYKNDQNLVNA